MRLEKKDLFLLIPATLLAIAGLGPDDPWVVGPCLFLSWLTFIIICAIHEGSGKARMGIAIVITVALGGVGYRRFHSIFDSPERTELNHRLETKKEPPLEMPPSESPSATKEAKPIKNPIDIVSMSPPSLSIANRGPVPLYLIDMLIKVEYPYVSQTRELNADLEPGKILNFPTDTRTLSPSSFLMNHGSTWKEHYEASLKLYSACELQMVFFSASDTGFKMAEDNYLKRGRKLIFADASATVQYRLQGTTRSDTQIVPLVGILQVANTQRCANWTD